MREFQERRRMKKLLHSRYVIVALLVVCIFLARGVWGVYQKYEKSREISDRVELNLTNLQNRQDLLNQSIDSLATPQGQEREIRDQFGVIKPGEKMIVLVDDASGTEKSVTTSENWWSRLLGLFGL